MLARLLTVIAAIVALAASSAIACAQSLVAPGTQTFGCSGPASALSCASEVSKIRNTGKTTARKLRLVLIATTAPLGATGNVSAYVMATSRFFKIRPRETIRHVKTAGGRSIPSGTTLYFAHVVIDDANQILARIGVSKAPYRVQAITEASDDSSVLVRKGD